MAEFADLLEEQNTVAEGKCKEASIKYVRTRGEGIQKSADFADKQSYRSADKGEMKSKNLKILRTYLMKAP